MKKLSTILVAILLLVAGCQTAATVKEAADDLVVTPAGMRYSSDIQTTTVNLSDKVSVGYRSYIEAQAGETRNNIVFVWVGSDIPHFPNVELTTNNITAGIEINQSSGGGFPGLTEQVLTINVLKNVKPGEYTFDIGLVIDGKDYGQLSCTINVTK